MGSRSAKAVWARELSCRQVQGIDLTGTPRTRRQIHMSGKRRPRASGKFSCYVGRIVSALRHDDRYLKVHASTEKVGMSE